MTRDVISREQFWDELEEAGEDEVRVRLKIGTYNNVNRMAPLAREWLQRKELAAVNEAARQAEAAARHAQETARRSEAVHEALEDRRAAVALRATVASERKAKAAERAMWVAIAALVLAIAALAVSVVGFLYK